jgi:hypothetical protein
MAGIYRRFPQEIDEQSAALIIRLQLADAELYSRSSKGKSREGESSDESSDEEVAFQMYKQEMESTVSCHLGKRMNQGRAEYVIQTRC